MNSADFAPSWLDVRGRAALQRIVDSLARRGLWLSLYESSAIMAARACQQYAVIASIDPALDEGGVIAGMLEEQRQDARRSLVSCLYLTAERQHVSALTGAGHDADLVAICQPLEPA